MPPQPPPPPSPNNPPRKPRPTLGAEIEVYWPLDALYYRGKIARVLPANRHRIFYNDGDVEDLDLSAEIWRPYCALSTVTQDASVDNARSPAQHGSVAAQNSPTGKSPKRALELPPPARAASVSQSRIVESVSATSSRASGPRVLQIEKVFEEEEASVGSCASPLPPRKRYKKDGEEEEEGGGEGENESRRKEEKTEGEGETERRRVTKVHQLLNRDDLAPDKRLSLGDVESELSRLTVQPFKL